jgi:hypothetical protein
MAVLWGDLASLCVFEERVGIVANEATFVEATALNVLSEYVQHSRRLASNGVLLMLKLVDFKHVHAPRVVDREIDSRAALVAIAAELNSGFAIEPHANTRQELRDSLLLLLLALLASIGVMAGNVHHEVAVVGKGRTALGAYARPWSEVDGGDVLLEGARFDKCTVTFGALERAFACMRSRVRFEVATLREAGATSDEVASVCFFAGVRALVRL